MAFLHVSFLAPAVLLALASTAQCSAHTSFRPISSPAISLPYSAPQSLHPDPSATIDAGILVGTTTSLPTATASVNKYLGVPFAQSPPVRFEPPQPLQKLPGKGVYEAKQWSPSCLQQFDSTGEARAFTELVFNNPAPEESEDCLYLNIYAPASPPPADGRAVMFWIYGGGLQFGNAGQPAYDGSTLASYEDVIVVSANYRTNVFGFPSSPELPATGHNLGLLDQRLALDWVQENIEAFGGSPDKVTIFGESAGGFSIDLLLTSFPANSTPPLRGAILESGQYSYRSAAASSSVPAWDRLVAALNCTSSTSALECVRTANSTLIQQIIDAPGFDFNPVPDNVTVVSNPAQRRLDGEIANIPVLGGTNSEEGRVFTYGQTNTTAFLASLGFNSSVIETLLAAYPLNTTSTPDSTAQIARIYTELIFQCPQALWANASASVGIPTWRYYFNASFVNTQAAPGLGVYHSSEIGLVFGTYPGVNVTTQEYALGKSMQGAWARFAKNPVGGPGWNQVGSGSLGQVLVGAVDVQAGGLLTAANGTVLPGAFDLGVLGNVGEVMGGGVTIIDQQEVDYRCGLYAEIYRRANALESLI